ncbi:MAG: O-antigen ligase family protein [Planctomycetaceae bacterium]|jgi:hypothetical protein|nr:O-antigen ligase family protein [Planctomycetaceae bacterium]
MKNKSNHNRKAQDIRGQNSFSIDTKSYSHENKTIAAQDNTNSLSSPSNSFSLTWISGAVLSGLISLTVILSGDLNERSGIVHFPAIFWLIFAFFLTSAPILFKHKTPKLIFTRLDIPVYLFFAYVLLSTCWNLLHGAAPRPTLNMLSVWILGAAAWFVFRQLLHGSKIIAAILLVVTAVVLVESCLAINQQFVDIPKIKQLVKENPINVVKQADPTIEPGTPEWDLVYSRLITALPTGTYIISNTLSGLLGSWLILILGIYTLGLSNRKFNPLGNNEIKIAKFKYTNEIIFGIFTSIIFLGFVLTKSRSGFIAVAIGVILLGLLLLQRKIGKTIKRFLFIVTIIFIVGITAINMTSGKDIINGAKKSFGFRLEYWTASMGIIHDYPIFGCGTGNFKHVYTHYKLPISSEEISDPHNFIVEIASTCGIPSMILFIFAVGLICFRTRKGSISNHRNCADSSFISEQKTQITPNDSNCNNQSSGGLFPYYIGGLIGCYVAFFLSLYSESPLGMDTIIASTIVFLVFAFVDNNRFEQIPSVVILAVLIVLFVHLSATSGITMTNTVILIWLFLSILANSRTSAVFADLQTWLRYGISVVFITFSLFINFFSFYPVISSNEILSKLEFVTDANAQVLLLEEAAKIDPYSATIQERLMRMAMLCYLQDPHNKKWYEIVEQSQVKAMKLAPRSGMIRYSCAELRAEAGRRLKNADLAKSSIEIYREAIKFYPNNASIRAAFAIILYQLGMKKESRIQAEIAIQLDDKMNHVELKIKPDKREALLKYIEFDKKESGK